jgi:lysyl-tRNA synthetase class 2
MSDVEDDTAAQATGGAATGGEISKNALKKQAKLEAAQRKKEEKAAAAAANRPAPAPGAGGASKKNEEEHEELDPSKYMENRTARLDAELGRNGQYPHKFKMTKGLKEFIKAYKDIDPASETKLPEERLTGRLMLKRSAGSKLFFYELVQDGVKIQILSQLQTWEGEDEASFAKMHGLLRRGDIVGVWGAPGKSKTGELSILPKGIILLSPCLWMLPKPKPGGEPMLTDVETRFRKRYLDLMLTPKTREVFQVRSKIINYVRRYLDMRDFLEVETPMMNVLAGGASARPFKTHHNDLNMELVMRIAPELFLKQLVVGGLDRVYEIGRQFRNEGMDMTHNPEFTTCEFYMAYADYEDLMTMTEEMLSGMVKEITGGYVVTIEGQQVNFEPPWKRVSMVSGLIDMIPDDLSRDIDLSTAEAREQLDKACRKHNINCPAPRTTTRLLDKLVGHFLEDGFVNPTFLCDHPVVMSPLAKWHRTDPKLTERFELFVVRKELCNAYTELNDPRIQRERFMDQMKDKAQGDDEAQPHDEGFCESLEYGLAPTGGWGLGIDRLCMFLTGNDSIREVLLFPAMKPLDHDVAQFTKSTTTTSAPAKHAAPKQVKAKVQDAEVDALEAKLRTLTFLSGSAPGAADKDMFNKVTGKSLAGYPLSAGWYSTLSMFEPNVRNSW